MTTEFNTPDALAQDFEALVRKRSSTVEAELQQLMRQAVDQDVAMSHGMGTTPLRRRWSGGRPTGCPVSGDDGTAAVEAAGGTGAFRAENLALLLSELHSLPSIVENNN